MSTNRRKFTADFKADAVQLVVVGNRPIAQVARELEINESSLGTGSRRTASSTLTRRPRRRRWKRRGSCCWRRRTGGWRT